MHMLRAVVLGMVISGALVSVSYAASENETLAKFVFAERLHDHRPEKRAEKLWNAGGSVLECVYRHRFSWTNALIAHGICEQGSPEKKAAMQTAALFAVVTEGLYQKNGMTLKTLPQGVLFVLTHRVFASWLVQERD